MSAAPVFTVNDLLGSDEDDILASLEKEFYQCSNFCQPEYLAHDDPATQLGLDGLPSVDVRDALKVLLTVSPPATEFTETWDFDGNVVNYREVPVSLDAFSQGNMALMEPSSRPAAPHGSDPLIGYVKLPFWPGGIDKNNSATTKPVNASGNDDEDWTSGQRDDAAAANSGSGKEQVDPWEMSPFRTSVACFDGLSDFPVVNDNGDGDGEQRFPSRDSWIEREELLLEPFDFLLPKAENEDNAPKKPPVVLDLTQMKLPALSSVIVGDNNYRYAIRVDPREAVSSTEFRRKIPEPARVFPFELDTFQKQAVLRMEEHNNVFVSAHTSAGKTVVAEYAIAMAIRHRARVIYTSPIKALSNQKFRDFKETFGDVGIITGDIQLRADASCLIMTTEILRSMLYNGSDVIRDTEWVIFDEVHYVNDPERGHVWEEAMILLPDNVNIVALSATVPNAMDFAEWIGQIKKRKVFVITTAFRPVPLEHNLCITWAIDKLFPLLKPHSVALDQRVYGLAMASKPPKFDSRQQYHQPGTLVPAQERQSYLAVIQSLQKNDNLPAVVFVFSKKKIEELTNELGTKVNLLTAKERGTVHAFFTKSLSKLKEVDRFLPQIQKVFSLLKVGVGMHHSGILPLLKEVVEILFQQGLCKLLFATETFSMGVNMPARTVVFDNIQKNDGRRRRELQPSEYIQMAGRAGRRGIDTLGMVIILCRNEVPEISVLDRMMLGKPVHLESKFRLTTSLVLGMMRVEHLKMEDVLRRTFAEYGWFREKSNFEDEYEKLVVKRRSMTRLECAICSADIFKYHSALETFWDQWADYLHRLLAEKSASKIFMPGRLMFVYFANNQSNSGGDNNIATTSYELRLAVFLTCTALNGKFNLKVLVLVPPGSSAALGRPPAALILLPSQQQPMTMTTQPVSTQFPNVLACPVEGTDFTRPSASSLGEDLEAGRLKLEVFDNLKPADIASFFSNKQIKLTAPPHMQLSGSVIGDAENEVLKFLKSVKPPDWSAASLVDPLKSSSAIQLSSLELASDAAQLTVVRNQLASPTAFACRSCPDFREHLRITHNDQQLANRLSAIRHHLSAGSLTLGPEYEAIVDLLHNMGFIDKDRGVLLLKGHVACVIGQQQDVLITELLFSGVFSDEMSPAELAGVLSPFVCEARIHESDEARNNNNNNRGQQQQNNATPMLDKGIKAVKEYGLNLGKAMHARRLIASPDSIITEDLRFALVDAVYSWANGLSFAAVKETTPVDEGLIVRCIQRTDELIRDLREGARIIGDLNLDSKLQQAQESIRRDIVFAASLYLQ